MRERKPKPVKAEQGNGLASALPWKILYRIKPEVWAASHDWKPLWEYGGKDERDKKWGRIQAESKNGTTLEFRLVDPVPGKLRR